MPTNPGCNNQHSPLATSLDHCYWRLIGNIVNGVGDIGVDAATSPVHFYRRCIVDIVDGVGDIGIDAATSPVHSYWRRIGNNGNRWQDWWSLLYEIDYFVEVTMKGVPCHWGLKNSWNSHWSFEPIMQWGTGQSQSIFWPTNHKRVMPANLRPCLLPHWQSHCNQARTV